MENKKILLVATTDNMIWQFLVPHIKHLEQLGNNVECACAKTGFWFDELVSMGIVMHQIDFTRNPISVKNVKGFKELVNLQKSQQYNLIYCQQPVGGVMGRKLAKKFKLPVIYTAHGFHFFKGNNPLKNLIFKTIEKYYATNTTALITMNEEDYNACKNWKAKKKYKINGIGFDNNKYSKDELNKAEFKKKLHLGNEFIIVTVAEFIKRKNYDTMLRTISNLKEENIKYLICGRGQEEDNIKALIKELGIENKVLLLGYRKDIDKIMQISNIFLLASHQEGLTLSVIEALNFGLPCVVSNVRGNCDLIENGKGGYVCNENDAVEFSNKIKILIDNKKLCEDMGKFNKELAKKYSIENVKIELKKIYKEI